MDKLAQRLTKERERHVHTSQTAGYTRTTARRLQDVVEALKY